MLVRSPTTTKPISGVMLSGSRPESCNVGATSVRRRSSVAASQHRRLPHSSRRAIAHRFRDRADVIRRRAATSADDVQPAIPRPFSQLRRQAFRRLRENQSAKADRAGRRLDRRSCRARCRARAPRCTAPSRPARARSSSPTTSGFACAIEVRNASTVWPLRMRPERSVTVPEMISGTLLPDFSKSFRDRRRSRPWRSACRKWFPPSGDRRRLRAAPSPDRRRPGEFDRT